MLRFLFVLVVFSCAWRAEALILYGLDNSANQSDPLTGVPYDAVAQVLNSGSGVTGSAVHWGGGYMLTANHVSTDLAGGTVTFDGGDSYTIDGGFTPQQVSPGVDLKIFKLSSTQGVTGVSDLAAPTFGTANTQVAWGWGVIRPNR